MTTNNITQSPLSRPREEGDIDVVSAVKAIMEELHYPLTSAWLAESNIVEAAGKNPETQRFLINRSLRIKLGVATIQTSIERFVLDSVTTIPEYLDNLRTRVIPALVTISLDMH